MSKVILVLSVAGFILSVLGAGSGKLDAPLAAMLAVACAGLGTTAALLLRSEEE